MAGYAIDNRLVTRVRENSSYTSGVHQRHSSGPKEDRQFFHCEHTHTHKHLATTGPINLVIFVPDVPIKQEKHSRSI